MHSSLQRSTQLDTFYNAFLLLSRDSIIRKKKSSHFPHQHCKAAFSFFSFPLPQIICYCYYFVIVQIFMKHLSNLHQENKKYCYERAYQSAMTCVSCMFKCFFFFKEAFVFNRTVSFLSLKGFDKPRGHIKRIFFFFFFLPKPKKKGRVKCRSFRL